MNSELRLDSVAKFYGDVLGVNGVSVAIEPGITGLVGPNGAGKSTLMNLIAGLLRPSRGSISVLGMTVDDRAFYRRIGYCTQYDAFPPGMTGREFVVGLLRVHGFDRRQALQLAAAALQRVGLGDAARRRIDVYSKGMRQALKLAQAICHGPRVLILDEPLNGLDPQARAEAVELFREFARQGAHVLISSHILHELDAVSDRVVFLDGGYVVAEGEVASIRGALATETTPHRRAHPTQVTIRCARGAHLAARLFADQHIVEARLHDDGGGLLVGTRDADAFFLALGKLAGDPGVQLDAVAPADESVEAVYEYLFDGAGRGAGWGP